MKKLFFLFVLFLFVASRNYSQDTIHVPADYPTIQAGINSASNGDFVLVNDGTYLENINFKGKAITVASWFLVNGDTNHINNTIINGSQPSHPDSGSVVYFVNGEDTTSVLCGFTITGGTGSLVFGPGFFVRNGGGIYCEFTGPKICYNKIVQNEVTDYTNNAIGGGLCAILSTNENLIVENNLFENNNLNGSYVYGGGLFIAADGECYIKKNKIRGNSINGISIANGAGIHCEPLYEYGVSISIVENIIAENSASTSSDLYSEGGGVSFYYTKAEFRNNLVVKNSARYGGGISIYNYFEDGIPEPDDILYRSVYFNNFLESSKIESDMLVDDFTFINNTIADNDATVDGGGIQSTGLVSKFINSIIWGNSAPAHSQISGSLQVEYSDVEGGYNGLGNIELDPVFADITNYYLTDGSSPCIDTGNPSALFNDIEDPFNPGYALWPALGTLSNDMGAYGGNPDVEIENLFVHGPHFQSFLDRILPAPYLDRQAIADSFITFIETFFSFPFIEENIIAYYIYKGTAFSITVPGDANGWDGTLFPMAHIEGTDFWYRGQVFELDARLDYKFVLNGSEWILDPRNPKQCVGGYGPNSELAMPDYVYPPEIIYNPSILHGTIQDTLFYSINLGNSRTIRVYTPPNYNPSLNLRYPLILLHDGGDWINLGFADNILDYLISENKIDPIVAVFVPPVNRDNEYAFSQRLLFEDFIVEELMPFIRSKYKVRLDAAGNAMTGFSFGGLISTQICYSNPEVFGFCGPMSPAYWPNDKQVLFDVLNGPKKDLKFYVDWGSYEFDLTTDGRILVENLISKGYENVVWNEWHEGHSWGNWYAHLDNVLEHFDMVVGVEREEGLPQQFTLLQNYPNPFNPITTIKYSIPKESFVTLKIFSSLGEEVETLVNELQMQGNYIFDFSANQLASGVYFYQLIAGEFIQTKKMLMIK